uniref:ATPBM n=1 Tax=Arundo donax TaxID=35708 RepID=A0A0A9GAF6_ARUDO
MGGRPSSNLTSTTAPMTWHTCPIAPAPVNSSVIFPPPVVFPTAGGEGGAAWVAAEVA